ncbi:hypothetical protein EON68_01965, partial [archaeon]
MPPAREPTDSQNTTAGVPHLLITTMSDAHPPGGGVRAHGLTDFITAATPQKRPPWAPPGSTPTPESRRSRSTSLADIMREEEEAAIASGRGSAAAGYATVAGHSSWGDRRGTGFETTHRTWTAMPSSRAPSTSSSARHVVQSSSKSSACHDFWEAVVAHPASHASAAIAPSTTSSAAALHGGTFTTSAASMLPVPVSSSGSAVVHSTPALGAVSGAAGGVAAAAGGGKSRTRATAPSDDAHAEAHAPHLRAPPQYVSMHLPSELQRVPAPNTLSARHAAAVAASARDVALAAAARATQPAPDIIIPSKLSFGSDMKLLKAKLGATVASTSAASVGTPGSAASGATAAAINPPFVVSPPLAAPLAMVSGPAAVSMKLEAAVGASGSAPPSTTSLPPPPPPLPALPPPLLHRISSSN